MTYPKGLQRYPNNLLWGSLSWYALFALGAGFFFMFSKEKWAELNSQAATQDEV